VLDTETTKSKGKVEQSGMLKKRKSDPMIIDEEQNNTVSASNSSIIQYEDIDQNDFDDPQAVAEYVNDIYEYLMEKEKDSVDPAYINNQVDVNEKMRAILVDWLVEVHRMFKLLPETLFLSVSLIDRYLSVTQISREKLQLVGVTAMLIASKYEEIYAPECNDFVYISDGAYTKQQILKMEQTLLNTLNFNITHPSSLHFLRRYSKAAGSDYTLHTLCKYLIELMLIDVKLLKYPPSLIAAGSVYLGRAMTQRIPLWTPTLEHYSTYAEQQVRGCALEMNDLLKKSQKSSLKAIRKKYSMPKFGQVAELPVVEL
jgi:cyclin B